MRPKEGTFKEDEKKKERNKGVARDGKVCIRVRASHRGLGNDKTENCALPSEHIMNTMVCIILQGNDQPLPGAIW